MARSFAVLIGVVVMVVRQWYGLLLCCVAMVMAVYRYKLVLGNQKGKGWWSSPIHPNATQKSIKDNNPGCPDDGCVNFKRPHDCVLRAAVGVPAQRLNGIDFRCCTLLAGCWCMVGLARQDH